MTEGHLVYSCFAYCRGSLRTHPSLSNTAIQAANQNFSYPVFQREPGRLLLEDTLGFLLSFRLLLWELDDLLRFLDLTHQLLQMHLTLCFRRPEEGTRCCGHRCEHPAVGDDWLGWKQPGQFPPEHLLALQSLLFSVSVQVAEGLFQLSCYEKPGAVVSHVSER